MERGYEDIEFKDVARVRKKRKKKHYFLRFLVFLAVCAGIYLFLTSGYFDVKNVTVKGSTYYTAEEVVSMSGWKEGGNIFFSAGIGEMEANLSEDPYFREVDISRRLPDTLEIEITERTQIAAFVYGDRYVVGYEDEDGNTYEPGTQFYPSGDTTLKVVWSDSGESEDDGSGTDWWIYAVVAIVILALIALVLILHFRVGVI